jgi:hypothetical protein
MLAVAESDENGEPVRETLAADVPAGGRSVPSLRRCYPLAGGPDLRDPTNTPTPTTSPRRSPPEGSHRAVGRRTGRRAATRAIVLPSPP